MRVNLLVTNQGYAPADDDALAIKRKYHKAGMGVVADVKVPRNGKFQRKFFALLRLAYDYWEPPDDRHYRGRTIEKNFERFRKDVTIMSGFYDAVWNLKGEMRIEAKSIAFGEMEETEFGNLYSATIDVLMRMVLDAKGFSRDDVDKLVGEILEFES